MSNIHILSKNLGYRNYFQRIPGVAMMLMFGIIFFGILSKDFLSVSNLTNIGLQSSILLLISLPMTLVIMTEGIDMSIGALLTFCGVVMAYTLSVTNSLPIAICLAMCCGLLVGLINGSIIVYWKLPPFVVTLGTLGICQSLALVVTDGQSITDVGEIVQLAYNGKVGGVAIPLIFYNVFFVISDTLWYLRMCNWWKSREFKFGWCADKFLPFSCLCF
jgi:ribose transport system permease protein